MQEYKELKSVLRESKGSSAVKLHQRKYLLTLLVLVLLQTGFVVISDYQAQDHQTSNAKILMAVRREILVAQLNSLASATQMAGTIQLL